MTCDDCGEAIDLEADRVEVTIAKLSPTRTEGGDVIGPAVPHEQPAQLHYHADHAPAFVG